MEWISGGQTYEICTPVEDNNGQGSIRGFACVWSWMVVDASANCLPRVGSEQVSLLRESKQPIKDSCRFMRRRRRGREVYDMTECPTINVTPKGCWITSVRHLWRRVKDKAGRTQCDVHKNFNRSASQEKSVYLPSLSPDPFGGRFLFWLSSARVCRELSGAANGTKAQKALPQNCS